MLMKSILQSTCLVEREADNAASSVVLLLLGAGFSLCQRVLSQRDDLRDGGAGAGRSVPDLLRLPRGSLDGALRHIESSLSTILTISFFKTHDMRMTLGASNVSGTLPILYVFLARSGKTIRDVA